MYKERTGSTCFWISRISWKWHPQSYDFTLGIKEEAQVFKSGEPGGWETTTKF